VLKYLDMDNVSISKDCWTLFGYALAWQLLYFIVVSRTTPIKK
jgi:hypothetical protein